jgi:hypothetical protein
MNIYVLNEHSFILMMILLCLISVNTLLKLPHLYILWLACLKEGALMNSSIFKIGLGIVVMMVALFSACLVTAEPAGNKPPVISSLEAENTSVYPKGYSEIRCVASDPEGDALQFNWSSTGGTLTGEGPTVAWESPNDYDDYYIMVTVKDVNGGSAEATLTISVIPRPSSGCCGQ